MYPPSWSSTLNYNYMVLIVVYVAHNRKFTQLQLQLGSWYVGLRQPTCKALYYTSETSSLPYACGHGSLPTKKHCTSLHIFTANAEKDSIEPSMRCVRIQEHLTVSSRQLTLGRTLGQGNLLLDYIPARTEYLLLLF